MLQVVERKNKKIGVRWCKTIGGPKKQNLVIISILIFVAEIVLLSFDASHLICK